MDKNQQPKIRALRRLVLAHITFQQVTAACDFLISHDSDEQAQFYGIFFSGICVSYIRPFMSAEQIGPLPSDYSTFPHNPEHAQTHEDLKNGRKLGLRTQFASPSSRTLGRRTTTARAKEDSPRRA
jgi:hypothetical protein